jgi:voltage-dependent calcium channel T type alpha-1G
VHKLQVVGWKERLREWTAVRETYSLYIWPPGDRFRIWCQDLTAKGWSVPALHSSILRTRFDFIILVFISANCITLAMERPNIPPWSHERHMLNVSNDVFTVVFAVEMILKAIANCYIFGETAYFKDNWNRMDGTLVIISLIGDTKSLLPPSLPQMPLSPSLSGRRARYSGC